MKQRKKKKVPAPNRIRKPIKRQIKGNRILYICPKCGKLWIQTKKMHRNLCMHCGQYLDWTGTDIVDCVYSICYNMEEAYFLAKKYEEIVGTSYGLDLDEWRLQNDRCWTKELMFPFLEHTDYGRFMRWAAKDGISKNFIKDI